MSYGLYFIDALPPWVVLDLSPLTLSSTDKALHTAGQVPALGAGFFNYPGRKLNIKAFGKMTSAATPGNFTWSIYWGTGADANGTILAASAAIALTANQATMSWALDIDVTCRVLGATGSLMCTGTFLFNESIAAAHGLIPATNAAAVAVDTTGSSIISVQAKRSGSTAETITIQEMTITSVN